MAEDPQALELLTKRYGDVTFEALTAVLTPQLIRITNLDKRIHKEGGGKHWRAIFSVQITEDNYQLMQRGRTGKFVPESFIDGGPWREICKGRIVSADYNSGVAHGEIYTGKASSKSALADALDELSGDDFLEIDQYGASAKIVSGLAEYYLSESAQANGYKVRRMPEDTAKHLGSYYNYDFEFEKNEVSKKCEVKSLWGTDTDYARLIHGRGPGYPTSSCKYETQDFFAISLFLRTGKIQDFAFAPSVPLSEDKPYGLTSARKHPEHVNQNPICEIGNGSWFSSIDEVWDLD